MTIEDADNKAASLNYNEINVGAVFSFNRIITKEDVTTFSNLTGDKNPLHVDPTFASKSVFKKNVVFGMLASSMFSTLVGMYCPGKNALYVSQSLFFRSPIFAGDVITVTGTVTSKTDSIKLITLKTEIFVRDKIVIDGEAKVKVLDNIE